MVTFVEGPLSVWGQISDDKQPNELFELSEKLQLVCPSANKIQGKPPLNKVFNAFSQVPTCQSLQANGIRYPDVMESASCTDIKKLICNQTV